MSRTRVQVNLTNRVATLVRPYPYDDLIGYWSYSVPNFQFIKGRFPNWDGKIKLLKRDKVPAGLFWATKDEIEKIEHIEFEINSDTQVITEYRYARNAIVSIGPYEFQNNCVNAMQDRLALGGGLVLNATGSGKTRIAAMLASRANCEICFIVDQLVLLDQARDDIHKHLKESIGYVGDQKFKLRRVTVATIQTLHAHRFDPKFVKWFENVDIIIIDEIHDQMNRRNFNVVDIAKPLAVFGLTATLAMTKKPVRLRAWALAGPVLYEYPLQKGMSEGVLARGIAILCEYDNSIREIVPYDAKLWYVKRLVENAERNHLITSLIKEANRRKKYVIVLAERINHLQEISHRLKSAGVRYRVVAGRYKGRAISKDSRIRSKKKFESGETRVLLASKVFQKGVDIKRVDVIIDAAGLRSKNNAIQKFGRGVRKHEDKTGLIYIDIHDTDRYDQYRDKKNWLATAAKSRKRALKKAGITIQKFQWIEHDDAKRLFDQAELLLQKEVTKK